MSDRLRRVLWIIDYFPRPHNTVSGVWALETVRAIKAHGVEVVVLAPTPWIPAWLGLTSTLRTWSAVPARWRIQDVEAFYPKCPHYPHRFVRHSLYRYVPWFESVALWPWCLPTIREIMEHRPFQVVHANFMFPSGFIGHRIQQRFGIPLVMHERSEQRLNTAYRHWWQRRIYAQVVSEAGAVITQNRRMQQRIEEIAPVAGEVLINRLGGNVHAAHTHKVPKPDRYRMNKVVLSVGALTERKGHAYLIRAMQIVRQNHPEAKCIVIGSGPQKKRLQRLISTLGLHDVVELYGRQDHDQVLRAMSWCDVFVLPSWDEASGTAYGEAMAAGRPVIACENEGIAECLCHGVHGLLVKPRDVESLAHALEMVLADDQLAARLGTEGRRLAEQELNYDVIAKRMIDLYRRLVG